MDNGQPNDTALAQKKYRQSQANKGLARFELQVSSKSKARFDEMVSAVAREYIKPRSERRRMAKARAQVFDEIIQGTVHHFFELKDQIEALRAEVKALSPAFFQTDNKAPLPEAISALPDDPKQLKAILAKTYKSAQQAKLLVSKYKQQRDQLEAMNECLDRLNDQLRIKLEENGLSVDERGVL